MASGVAFAKPEDRFADGPVALQKAGAGSQRVLDASARLQFDSRRDDAGGLGVGQIAVGNQFQGDASNAQSVFTDSVVEDFERSVVRSIAGGHCHPHRRSPSRSHGTAKSQTPSKTLPILM